MADQSYIPAMTEKIRTLRHILEEKGLQTDIEIDGGVDTKNLRMVIEAVPMCLYPVRRFLAEILLKMFISLKLSWQSIRNRQDRACEF